MYIFKQWSGDDLWCITAGNFCVHCYEVREDGGIELWKYPMSLGELRDTDEVIDHDLSLFESTLGEVNAYIQEDIDCMPPGPKPGYVQIGEYQQKWDGDINGDLGSVELQGILVRAMSFHKKLWEHENYNGNGLDTSNMLEVINQIALFAGIQAQFRGKVLAKQTVTT